MYLAPLFPPGAPPPQKLLAMESLFMIKWKKYLLL